MINHPPYHLRPNKAVDRLAFFEVIRILERLSPIDDYTYHGLGGPYLEEFRLLYEFHPKISMISLERDSDTYKRQRFHLPCAKLRLAKKSMSSFLTTYSSNDRKSIFWLDYTDLRYAHFGDFIGLLPKVAENSLVKISIRSEPRDFDVDGTWSEFIDEFGEFISDRDLGSPKTSSELARLLQKMFQVAAQKALPYSSPFRFQPLSSFFYHDGAGMFSLTGIVCSRGPSSRGIKKVFSPWDFANLNWGNPIEIDLPILSTKERLWLQGVLPTTRSSVLGKHLGYRLGGSRKQTRKHLKQYSLFHRYFPHFVKANL